MVLSYAIVRSVLCYFIPSVAVICYLKKQVRLTCCRPHCFIGACKEIYSVLSFLCLRRTEAVGMILLGFTKIAGNVWRAYVVVECVRFHSGDLEPDSGVGRTLKAFELIFTVTESIFILMTIAMTVSWVYRKGTHAPGPRPTAKEFRHIAEKHQGSPPSEASSVCVVGYLLASILILLISSAADEVVEETTFSSHRKCNPTPGNSTCAQMMQSNANVSNTLFSPVSLQFCFVTLIFLVKLLMKSTGNVRTASQNTQDTPTTNEGSTLLRNPQNTYFGPQSPWALSLELFSFRSTATESTQCTMKSQRLDQCIPESPVRH